MYYNTRFKAETIRAALIDDHNHGMRMRDLRSKYRLAKSTIYRWIKRPSVLTRSSRPQRQPRRLHPQIEQRILAARQAARVGPNRLSDQLGIPASTIYKVLKRHGINRLFPKIKLPAVRYEHPEAGDLVHVDVKKLGAIGLSGPHCWGRGPGECLHLMIDDHSRALYVEIHANETAATSSAFLERGVEWFASLGVQVRRVLSDRGRNYISGHWRDTAQLLGMRAIYCRIRHPQTNGKCERVIRTIVDEALRNRDLGNEQARAHTIEKYVAYYNSRRQHTALGGLVPLQRLLPKR
jgi:transposase InsO family protein